MLYRFVYFLWSYCKSFRLVISASVPERHRTLFENVQVEFHHKVWPGSVIDLGSVLVSFGTGVDFIWLWIFLDVTQQLFQDSTVSSILSDSRRSEPMMNSAKQRNFETKQRTPQMRPAPNTVSLQNSFFFFFFFFKSGEVAWVENVNQCSVSFTFLHIKALALRIKLAREDQDLSSRQAFLVAAEHQAAHLLFEMESSSLARLANRCLTVVWPLCDSWDL